MSTQIVQHKSRDFDVVLNFAESENNLSWAFTAENDGEIYDVILTNVASYQIAGSSVILPYTVLAGISYSVTIAKQTNGQTASITLKTRRAVSKSVTFNVPDFWQYTGRFVFVLTESGKILKLDTNLLTPSNFNAGSWLTNPIIAEIALPIISEVDHIWSTFCFVKNNGVEKILIFGGANNMTTATNLLCCVLDINTNVVYNDINYTLQNSYSLLTTAPRYGRPLTTCYDYVNEIVFIGMSGGSNGSFLPYFNLSTGLLSLYPYTSTPQSSFKVSNSLNKYYNPIDGLVIEPGSALSLHPGPGTTKWYWHDTVAGLYNSTYYRRLNALLAPISSTAANRYNIINMLGIKVGQVNINSIILQNHSSIILYGNSDILFQVPFSANINKIAFSDLITTNSFFIDAPNLIEGQTFFNSCTASPSNNLCIALSNGTSLNRLHIFKDVNCLSQTYDYMFLDIEKSTQIKTDMLL